MEVEFDDLETANLVIDCIYKGGKEPNIVSEPFHKLIPGCENAGGFRKKLRVNSSEDNKEDILKKYAYIVLYTSMEEFEWPDYLDEETGVFRYYGDNREAGRSLNDTKKKGNAILEAAFAAIDDKDKRKDIPPFFVFKKTGVGRDIQFLGLAAPGNPNLSSDNELISIWRTVNNNRFQNYAAYFTILNTGAKAISRKWIENLIDNHDESIKLAPEKWRSFIENGRKGIVPLKAPRETKVPFKDAQLPDDDEGKKCLEIIRNHYEANPQGFEACATDIVSKMDKNFIEFIITRPWRDGGRDAMGIYSINLGSKINPPLKIECALEAKRYASDKGVGVKEMSRLISRIKNRQFGIMVTTSYVGQQAYNEVIKDGHPILIVTAKDIAGVLKQNFITSSNIDRWLDTIDKQNPYNVVKGSVQP